MSRSRLASRVVLWSAAFLSILAATRFANAADPKIGDSVFLKDDARVTLNKISIDVNYLRSPATVEAIQGEWLWIARGWVNRRDVMSLDEAFDVYSKALEADPESAAAWANRAAARLARGDAERAIVDLNKALERTPRQVVWLARRGDAYTAIGFYEDAMQDYRTAIAAAPLWAASYVRAGESLSRQGNHGEACVYFASALKLEYTDPYCYAGLGEAFLGLAEHEKAATAFTNALRHDKAHVPAYVGRGEARRALGRLDDALADFDQALRRLPTARAYAGRALVRQAQARYRDARNDFAAALRLDDANAAAHAGLALLLSAGPDDSLREGAKALEHAERAVALTNERDASALAALAAALAETGDFDDAIEKQTRVVELAPESSRAEAQQRLDDYRAKRPRRLGSPVAATP